MLFSQKAEILGFPTHAAFVLDMRMAKSPESVATFLKDLSQKLKPLKDKDMETFLQYKKEEVSSSIGKLHNMDCLERMLY